MPLAILPRFSAPDSERAVRVLAVYDGDVARSQAVIASVVAAAGAALGEKRFAAAVRIDELDLASEPSRKAQLARCRKAEIVIGLDAEHLRELARPWWDRHRIFTLEELTLTLEAVATAPGGHTIVSLLERGCAAFSRSVITTAFAAKRLVPAVFLARRRAGTVEEYAPRLGSVLGELALGRSWAP